MVQVPPDLPSQEKPLVALETVLRQMRDLQDAGEIVQLAVDYLIETFAAPLVWVSFYDPAEHALVGQGGATLIENFSLLKETLLLEPGQILEQVVIEQRPAVVPDLRQETRMGVWNQHAMQLEIIGCLIYPIRFDKRCLGLLMMGSQLWGGIASEEEKALLGILTGQIASSLQVLEEKWRHRAQKQADIPLLALSTAMRNFETIDERVQAAIAQVQAFVENRRVRVFWYERDRGNEFIARWANRSDGKGNRGKSFATAPTFDARTLGITYSALLDGQCLVIGESGLSARVPISAKVLKALNCRSGIFAPILFQGELLGFMSVESDTLRNWSEPEQSLVMGAAQLIALIAPLENLENTLARIQDDRTLTSQVAQSIYITAEWDTAIKEMATKLCNRLNASSCLVLQAEAETNSYEVRPLYTDGNWKFPSHFPALSGRDLEDILQSDETVAAESYPDDLRLMGWQEVLGAIDVRSAIAASCDTVKSSAKEVLIPKGILVLLEKTPRAWKREDRQLVQLVARQLGVVLEQWHLTKCQQRLEKLFDGIPEVVAALSMADSPDMLYETAAKHLQRLLGAPLVTILSWRTSRLAAAEAPGKAPLVEADIRQALTKGDGFELTPPTEPIVVERDALVQWCLQSPYPIAVGVGDLPPSTRQWLNSADLGQVMAVALDTTDTPYIHSSLMVIGAAGDRQWLDCERMVLSFVRTFLALTIDRLVSQKQLTERVVELTELNWFKHRNLNLLHNNFASTLTKLQGALPDKQERIGDHWKKMEDSFRALVDFYGDIKPIGQEYWQPNWTTTSVSSVKLIRRVMRRAEAIVKKQKIWPRIHGGDTAATLNAHPGRLELVLVEVIALIAKRNHSDGRLDIWTQVEGDWWVMSLVDAGQPLPPPLLECLESARQAGSNLAWFSPLFINPLLQDSPGRELFMCQATITQMKGMFDVYRSEDGRTVTTISLPLIPEEEG